MLADQPLWQALAKSSSSTAIHRLEARTGSKMESTPWSGKVGFRIPMTRRSA